MAGVVTRFPCESGYFSFHGRFVIDSDLASETIDFSTSGAVTLRVTNGGEPVDDQRVSVRSSDMNFPLGGFSWHGSTNSGGQCTLRAPNERIIVSVDDQNQEFDAVDGAEFTVDLSDAP